MSAQFRPANLAATRTSCAVGTGSGRSDRLTTSFPPAPAYVTALMRYLQGRGLAPPTVRSQHKDVSCPCCGHSARVVACERGSRINVGEAGGVREGDVTIARWAKENPRSAALHRQASTLLPGGVTHDVRLAEPFP